MLKIDQTIFEKVASSATNSDNLVFSKIEPHLEWTESQLRAELFGDMLDKLDSVPNLHAVAIRLVCLRTYYEQIPQLDLWLAPNGFGVVSTQNLAPASADRVRALRLQVKQAYENDYDKAIEMLIGTEWAESTQARINIVNMIYTAKLFKMYTDKADAHRSDMEEAHSQIYVAEEKIREYISAEFFDALLEKIRTDKISKLESAIIDMICRFTGLCVTKQYTPAKSLLDRISQFAEDHADDFAEYKNSKAYKVKHFEYYQNEKEDSSYFFG